MKFLKTFEDLQSEPKVGDYVIVIAAYGHIGTGYVKIKNGDRCKIIKTGKGKNYFIIENENGEIEEYRKNRFISELEYNINKYNL